MRTGSEPTTARSPLRMRLWLSVWGLIWAIAGTAAFALVGRTGWAVACGVLWLIVTVVATVILANLVAAVPGRSAARTRPAVALRDE